MNCKNCSARLEGEDSYRMEHNASGDLVRLSPAKEYVCAECGSVFEWVRGERLHVIFDGIDNEYKDDRLETSQ